jgi:hypothetical protein
MNGIELPITNQLNSVMNGIELPITNQLNEIQINSYFFPDHVKADRENLYKIKETRSLNLSLDGLYSTLIEKIQQAYGALLPNKEDIRTYSLSKNHELIKLKSDSDLQYAIKTTTIFKVYVAREASKEEKYHLKKKTMPQEILHINFDYVCRGCDRLMDGNRHKCLVCTEYILCQRCESENIHKEHSMKYLRLSDKYLHARLLLDGIWNKSKPKRPFIDV